MPRILSDIVRGSLDAQPDMEVVGARLPRDDVPLAVRETDADVVIVELQDAARPEDWHALLDDFPHLGVLAISADEHDARLYELRPQVVVAVRDVSPSGLVDAIRSTRVLAGRRHSAPVGRA